MLRLAPHPKCAKVRPPQKIDIEWFQSLGGMIGKGPRPHAGRINGGSKAWFWFTLLAGFIVGTTGLILDFPEFGLSSGIIQVAHIIHAAMAVFFMAGSLGHIYLGSIGAEGTFEGMRSGKVSAQWAKQHNDVWYAEVMKGMATAENRQCSVQGSLPDVD